MYRPGSGKDGEAQDYANLGASAYHCHRAEGEVMSHEEFERARKRLSIFQEFSQTIFGDDAVMITPYQYGEPDARDVYRFE